MHKGKSCGFKKGDPNPTQKKLPVKKPVVKKNKSNLKKYGA